MQCVYCVVLNTGIVRFGRSGNVLKRTADHVTESKRQGASLVRVFVSNVQNDIAEERNLISAAHSIMSATPCGGFRAKALTHIAQCFDAVRLGYFLMRVEHRPLRLIMDNDLCDHIPQAHRQLHPDERRRNAILDFVAGQAGGCFVSDIKPAFPSYQVRDIEAALEAMVGEGSVRMFWPKSPLTGGELRFPKLRKVEFIGGDDLKND